MNGEERDELAQQVSEAADSARVAAEHAASRAHGPVIDVLQDVEDVPGHEMTEDDDTAPPPPTGDSFGVATPVRPPGLSKKTLAIVSVVGFGFLLVLLFGIIFGIESKATSPQHAVAVGDLMKKKPFSQAAGGGVVSPDAFSTPAPNGTPFPYSPYTYRPNGQMQQGPYPMQQGPYRTQPGTYSYGRPPATPVPGVVLSRDPNCVVQPGYAGPAQPGCPVQQSSPYGTTAGSSYQSSSGSTYTQATPSPAEIAAERERQQRIADLQSATQASAFVSDSQPGSSQSTGTQQSNASTNTTPNTDAIAAAIAAERARQQQQYGGQQPYAGSTPAPTPPPANYLNVGVGVWIPITTIGSIDCAVPGWVTAQVRDKVPDVTGTYTLIPAFSKVIGQTINSTPGHCDISWTTLRLPNGNELALRAYRSQDSRGESGIGGTVDDHRWSIARTGLYAASVAAAAGYTMARAQQQSGGVVIVTQTSPSQQAIQAAIGPIQSAADRVIGMDANRVTDLRVPDGTHLNLYVDSPIYLPPWQQ